MGQRLFAAAALVFLLARVAGATVANDICPAGTDPCIVSNARVITANSTLDFQQRTLILQLRGSFTANSGDITILAGTVTMEAGARIVAPGIVTVTVTDDITVGADGDTLARIDVSGSTVSHAIKLTAGDDVTIQGRLIATGTANNPGGTIDIMAGGDISFTGDVDIPEAGQAGAGVIRWTAVGGVAMSGTINGKGDGLDGGDIDIRAGTGNLNMSGGLIDVSGGGSFGSGGFVALGSDQGSVIVGGTIKGTGSTSAADCGDGASILFEAGLDVSFQVTGLLTLDSGFGCLAGDVEASAGRDVLLSGTIDATGRGAEAEGGAVSLLAIRNISISGPTDLSATAEAPTEEFGGSGGLFDATAGATLTVSNTINGDGALQFGAGGTILLQSCTLELKGTGRLTVLGDTGFVQDLVSGLMTVNGIIRADETLIQFRDAAVPPVLNGSIIAAPTLELTPALPACGQIVVPTTTSTTTTTTTSTTTASTTSASTTTSPSTTTPTTTSTTTATTGPSVTTTSSTGSTSTTTGTSSSTTTITTESTTTTGSTSTTTSTGASTTSTSTTTESTTSSTSTTTTSSTSTSSSSSSSTTTSSSSTPTTTATSTTASTTTTVTSTSTTSTTLPALELCGDGIDNDGDQLVDCADPGCFGDPVCLGQCSVAATYESINCRLDALIADVLASPDLGALQAPLSEKLGRVRARKQQSELHCEGGSTRRATSSLRRAIRRMISLERTLRQNRAGIPATVIAPFLATADEIRLDMRSLAASGIQCPGNP